MAHASVIFIYIPCRSDDEARAIGRTVVEEKLAACANIFNGPHSIYHWQGKIEEADEALLILKTRPEVYDTLAARVTALHSYETPCIAALPIEKLNAPFAAWIRKETE